MASLPGPRYFDDVLSGVLFLATAILLFYVFWSLLARSFTLTLLTALAGARQPLTQEQWISIYMQGGDLSTFAHNRLRLLLGLWNGGVGRRRDRCDARRRGNDTSRKAYPLCDGS